MYLNRWILKRVRRGPGVPLTKAGTRDLDRLLGAWEVPKAWQWWIQLSTPVLTSQRIWRRWQKSLAKPEEGDVRPTQIRELILCYGWLGKVPQRLCRPATCPQCGSVDQLISYGTWKCPLAAAMWRKTAALWAAVTKLPAPSMDTWGSAALGVIHLGDGDWPELCIWFTLNGATLRSLHHAWCAQAHGEQRHPEQIWGDMRASLASMVLTAWELVKRDKLETLFLQIWGRNNILGKAPASPQRAKWKQKP